MVEDLFWLLQQEIEKDPDLEIDLADVDANVTTNVETKTQLSKSYKIGELIPDTGAIKRTNQYKKKINDSEPKKRHHLGRPPTIVFPEKSDWWKQFMDYDNDESDDDKNYIAKTLVDNKLETIEDKKLAHVKESIQLFHTKRTNYLKIMQKQKPKPLMENEIQDEEMDQRITEDIRSHKISEYDDDYDLDDNKTSVMDDYYDPNIGTNNYNPNEGVYRKDILRNYIDEDVEEKFVMQRKAIAMLQEICLKNYWPLPTYDMKANSNVDDGCLRPVVCRVKNISFRKRGPTKNFAKELAAKAMYEYLQNNPIEPDISSD